MELAIALVVFSSWALLSRGCAHRRITTPSKTPDGADHSFPKSQKEAAVDAGLSERQIVMPGWRS